MNDRMTTRPDARTSMVQAAAALLSRVGLEGTTFRTVLAESGAPRGSIYHHFPDGKTQLVAEAVTWVGARLTGAIDAMSGLPADDVARRFLALWRGVLERSDTTAGCAVAAVTVDTATVDTANVETANGTPAAESGDETEALRSATSAVFADWQAALATALADGGVPTARSSPLAATLLAGVEGALILARSHRDLATFDAIADELVALVAAAVTVPPT